MNIETLSLMDDDHLIQTARGLGHLSSLEQLLLDRLEASIDKYHLDFQKAAYVLCQDKKNTSEQPTGD